MSTPVTAPDLQAARAAHLRDLFEPWSLRRLEARTGIGRGTLQTRFNGSTALTMADIEILAPVIRMTPEELFAELRTVPATKKDPAHEEAGSSECAPWDSNPEPIEYSIAPITRLVPRSTSTAKQQGKDALVTSIDWIFGKHETDRQKAMVRR